MRAIVQTGREALAVRRRERPGIDDDEVLLRVHAAGVCGSDVHSYRRDEGYQSFRLPRTLGHEFAATVAETGADVTEYDAGDLVIEEPVHYCGACGPCKRGRTNLCSEATVRGLHEEGAYAEFVRARPRYLHRVPGDVPPALAALAEPLSVAVRAVVTRSRAAPEARVLVEGPGPIGVLSAVVADAAGARVLVSGLAADESHRLPLVERLSLETVNVERRGLADAADAFTDGRGFDVAIDATGHHSGLGQALEHLRPGGQAVVVGLPVEPATVPVGDAVRAEIEVTTSYCSRYDEFERALSLLADRPAAFEPIIDEYPVGTPEDAFEAFVDGRTCKPVFAFAPE